MGLFNCHIHFPLTEKLLALNIINIRMLFQTYSAIHVHFMPINNTNYPLVFKNVLVFLLDKLQDLNIELQSARNKVVHNII